LRVLVLSLSLSVRGHSTQNTVVKNSVPWGGVERKAEGDEERERRRGIGKLNRAGTGKKKLNRGPKKGVRYLRKERKSKIKASVAAWVKMKKEGGARQIGEMKKEPKIHTYRWGNRLETGEDRDVRINKSA